MAKWIIPRHKPKKDPEWAMEDKNHGRKFSLKRKRNEDIVKRSRKREMQFLALVTHQNDEVKAGIATMKIGQCARKTSLSYKDALRCARSAALETGRDMFAYQCKWCGSYHLTSHPINGIEYPIFVKGFNGEKQWINRNTEENK